MQIPIYCSRCKTITLGVMTIPDNSTQATIDAATANSMGLCVSCAAIVLAEQKIEAEAVSFPIPSQASLQAAIAVQRSAVIHKNNPGQMPTTAQRLEALETITRFLMKVHFGT